MLFSMGLRCFVLSTVGHTSLTCSMPSPKEGIFKNNTALTGYSDTLALFLLVFFPKIIGVGMLPHRSGFLHTSLGKCLF